MLTKAQIALVLDTLLNLWDKIPSSSYREIAGEVYQAIKEDNWGKCEALLWEMQLSLEGGDTDVGERTPDDSR